jgi:hypothetical protein
MMVGDNLTDLGVDGRVILKWILKDVRVTMGSNVELF